MPDTTADDVYNDPDNILADDDDTVDGKADSPANNDDLSQSVDVPERDTTDLDDRGSIPELESADGGQKHDEDDPDYPEDSDPDSDHLGDMDPADEQDGTER